MTRYRCSSLLTDQGIATLEKWDHVVHVLANFFDLGINPEFFLFSP